MAINLKLSSLTSFENNRLNYRLKNDVRRIIFVLTRDLQPAASMKGVCERNLEIKAAGTLSRYIFSKLFSINSPSGP